MIGIFPIYARSLPPRSPARSAAPPGTTCTMSNPKSDGNPICSASSGVIGIVRTPSAGLRTRPSVTRSFSTAFAVLIGIANPIPALCPTFEAIIVLMPITSPCQFSSGPPEFPGLIAASVWIASSITIPSGSCTGRIELMMPRVIVPLRPNGFPIA